MGKVERCEIVASGIWTLLFGLGGFETCGGRNKIVFTFFFVAWFVFVTFVIGFRESSGSIAFFSRGEGRAVD